MSNTPHLKGSVAELLAYIVERLPGEWQLCLFAAIAILIGIIIAISNNSIKAVLISSCLFLVITFIQFFVEIESLFLSFLPFIIGAIFTGGCLSLYNRTEPLWINSLSTAFLVAGILTPVKLILYMEDIQLRVIVLSSVLSIPLYCCLFLGSSKTFRYLFNTNQT